MGGGELEWLFEQGFEASSSQKVNFWVVFVFPLGLSLLKFDGGCLSRELLSPFIQEMMTWLNFLGPFKVGDYTLGLGLRSLSV